MEVETFPDGGGYVWHISLCYFIIPDQNKLCERLPQYAPAPCDLDLLTLKIVSESRVTWDSCVPSLVFLGLSVLDLGPIYATDRQTADVRQHHRLMPPPRAGGGGGA